jgi:hypothetical protein
MEPPDADAYFGKVLRDTAGGTRLSRAQALARHRQPAPAHQPHSAMSTGPVSTIYFAKTRLRGQAATLERLRVDRQLEEALAHGPDPLHLAAVFGLDPKTAIRYAENARLLLTTRAEEQDPASSREPKSQNEP